MKMNFKPFENFRPSYPNDGHVGYRLAPGLWAECVEDREYSELDGGLGVEVTYLLYTRGMTELPEFSAVDQLLEILRTEYKSVTGMGDGPTVLASDSGRCAILIALDCWSGVPGA